MSVFLSSFKRMGCDLEAISTTTTFIVNSIFHLSLELLTKFWKTNLKIVQQLLSFIVDAHTF